jgi:protein subunit release factor A
MGDPTFWDNNERAQKHIGKVNALKRAVLPVVDFRKRVADLDVMQELIDSGTPDEKDEFGAELTGQVDAMLPELDKIEIGAFLTGQFDRNNAIFSIQAGAGGTESNDWADILYRMYNRWAERRGLATTSCTTGKTGPAEGGLRLEGMPKDPSEGSVRAGSCHSRTGAMGLTRTMRGRPRLPT